MGTQDSFCPQSPSPECAANGLPTEKLAMHPVATQRWDPDPLAVRAT